MAIWVDADACPKLIKEILFRAAERTGVQLNLVANHHIPVPKRANIRFMQVAQGFDIADNEIVQQVTAHELVITGDIPLAAEVIEKGAMALSPRGETFTPENIKQRLNIRDFMDTMRASGIETKGPPSLSQADRQAFANALDKYLASH